MPTSIASNIATKAEALAPFLDERARRSRAGSDSGFALMREAVALLHEASGGTHRELDRYASLALRAAARRKKKLVERDAVAAILDAKARSDA